MLDNDSVKILKLLLHTYVKVDKQRNTSNINTHQQYLMSLMMSLIPSVRMDTFSNFMPRLKQRDQTTSAAHKTVMYRTRVV